MGEKIDADVIVIGAGVIGLACGRALAMAGRDVILIESENHIAEHTSSRNSEVMHAGIYYPKNSRKAQFCVEGQEKLYRYCEQRSVPHKRCGKLIVCADPKEDAELEAIMKRGQKNNARDLSLIDGDHARKLEPALSPNISSAIYSQGTGIIDSHAYMLALQGELEDHGGMIAYGTTIKRGEFIGNGVRLYTNNDDMPWLSARTVINAAGNNAIDIAQKIEGPHVADLPIPRFAKGSYFSVMGKMPFSHLIYPMPNKAGLGVHLTLDLAGQGRLGPNVEWLPDGAGPPFDYSVDETQADLFFKAAKSYWPSLKRDALSSSYSGIRPKLVGPGDIAGDFLIDADPNASLINLLGIESPGLTSSLSIAEYVLENTIS